MNNELPSYFRRGLGVVSNHRQSPSAPFPGQPLARTTVTPLESARVWH